LQKNAFRRCPRKPICLTLDSAWQRVRHGPNPGMAWHGTQTWNIRRLSMRHQFKCNGGAFVWSRAGWPDWANFRPMGDILLWVELSKLLK
jgi:hypothetical protein